MVEEWSVMASVVADGLEVCTDCALMIANGEGSEDHARKVSSVWGADAIGLVLTCSDEDCSPPFSWSRCDGCGSTLGGDRHEAAVIR
jgi:hypothetical protein